MIRLLDVSLDTPEENLAMEESLWNELEHAAEGGSGTLRFWESRRYFVVLGYSGRPEQEVRGEACEQAGVPVLRRITGGGAVLQGPGCLNYTLALSLEAYPALRDVRRSLGLILGKVRAALGLEGIAIRGLCDLALNERKISGNAQRRGRRTLLHQGTLLYNFDAALVERYLQEPPRQPDYRRGRRHVEFMGNLPVGPQEIKRRLACEEWWTWRDSNSRPLPCHLRNINHLQTAALKTKDLAGGGVDAIWTPRRP